MVSDGPQLNPMIFKLKRLVNIPPFFLLVSRCCNYLIIINLLGCFQELNKTLLDLGSSCNIVDYGYFFVFFLVKFSLFGNFCTSFVPQIDYLLSPNSIRNACLLYMLIYTY
ncbi:hypothetical protein HDE68_000865 [Pedobacter cryoconitis]|uniref:Uncharacterized protein n=1 Tax=Pedobacter cryoconitis TaxID=188932 RepID=A0A7W8ZJH8_9SPHI|nr:hypothetical protein [Pedobacter cryoconitis]